MFHTDNLLKLYIFVNLTGGPLGMQTEACKHIENLALDDTFYIIDLGNVQRMYKVNILGNK